MRVGLGGRGGAGGEQRSTNRIHVGWQQHDFFFRSALLFRRRYGPVSSVEGGCRARRLLLMLTDQPPSRRCLLSPCGVYLMSLARLSGSVLWPAQASAVANGGGYLLDQERDQEVAYEEERRRRCVR